MSRIYLGRHVYGFGAIFLGAIGMLALGAGLVRMALVLYAFNRAGRALGWQVDLVFLLSALGLVIVACEGCGHGCSSRVLQERFYGPFVGVGVHRALEVCG